MYDDLLKWVLRVHAAILPVALVCFYRYSDRAGLFEKTLGDTTDFLTRMQQRIAGALEASLSPVLSDAGTEATIDAQGVFRQKPRNPVGSDRLREAILAFVELDVDLMADYRATLRARSAWCRWAKALSWVVPFFAAWESICVGIVGLGVKLVGWQMPEHILKWSFVPSALFVGAFFLCQVILLRQHDTIHDNKDRYHRI